MGIPITSSLMNSFQTVAGIPLMNNKLYNRLKTIQIPEPNYIAGILPRDRVRGVGAGKDLLIAIMGYR
jgi:hypothetical protein